MEKLTSSQMETAEQEDSNGDSDSDGEERPLENSDRELGPGSDRHEDMGHVCQSFFLSLLIKQT